MSTRSTHIDKSVFPFFLSLFSFHAPSTTFHLHVIRLLFPVIFIPFELQLPSFLFHVWFRFVSFHVPFVSYHFPDMFCTFSLQVPLCSSDCLNFVFPSFLFKFHCFCSWCCLHPRRFMLFCHLSLPFLLLSFSLAFPDFFLSRSRRFPFMSSHRAFITSFR